MRAPRTSHWVGCLFVIFGCSGEDVGPTTAFLANVEEDDDCPAASSLSPDDLYLSVGCHSTIVAIRGEGERGLVPSRENCCGAIFPGCAYPVDAVKVQCVIQ
jgi:hypothetical protein